MERRTDALSSALQEDFIAAGTLALARMATFSPITFGADRASRVTKKGSPLAVLPFFCIYGAMNSYRVQIKVFTPISTAASGAYNQRFCDRYFGLGLGLAAEVIFCPSYSNHR